MVPKAALNRNPLPAILPIPPISLRKNLIPGGLGGTIRRKLLRAKHLFTGYLFSISYGNYAEVAFSQRKMPLERPLSVYSNPEVATGGKTEYFEGPVDFLI